MADVKVFCGQTNRQTGKKLYAPDLSMQGHRNTRAVTECNLITPINALTETVQAI